MTIGAVDAQGRSTGWMLELNSTTGKRLHVVRFMDGAMSCDRTTLDQPLNPVNGR